MKCYVGTKIITAEPEAHSDGRPGYRVIYPDGYSSWSPRDTFEIAYREVTFHERQLLVQTDAEHQISAISDGKPDDEDGEDGECQGWIPGEYMVERDERKCARCGAYAGDHPRSDYDTLDTQEKVDAYNAAHPVNQMRLGDTVRRRR